MNELKHSIKKRYLDEFNRLGAIITEYNDVLYNVEINGKNLTFPKWFEKYPDYTSNLEMQEAMAKICKS